MKKLYTVFLSISLLLFLAACSPYDPTQVFLPTSAGSKSTHVSVDVATKTKDNMPTVIVRRFAATSGGGGPRSVYTGPDNPDSNLCVIDAAVDRPVAVIHPDGLRVPLRAQGVVYIQNDSDVAQTLVSDTPDGWQPFTIPPHYSLSLVFKRGGTFEGHLKDFPVTRLKLEISLLFQQS